MSAHICPLDGSCCVNDLCSSRCIANGDPTESECLCCGEPIGYCTCEDEDE